MNRCPVACTAGARSVVCSQRTARMQHNCDETLTQCAGYYTDSILKFRLTFPSNYPERPPVVQFLTDVFHPLISQQDGTFNLAPRFRPWRCDLLIRVWQVISIDEAGIDRRSITFSTCCIGSKRRSRSTRWTRLKRETASTRRRTGACRVGCTSHSVAHVHGQIVSTCGTAPGPHADGRVRYHDTTSSFAALATQSSMLSQSASALFDRDHPSMAGKGAHSMQFKELKPEQLSSLRAKIGLKEWDVEDES